MDDFERRLAASMKHAASVQPDLSSVGRARSRSVAAGAVAAVLVAASITAVYLVARPSEGGDPRPAAPAPSVYDGPYADVPDSIDVRCSPDGVHLSAEVVRTQAAGAVLNVSSTLPEGDFISYGSTGTDGITGGQGLPVEPTTWALDLAPGTITIGCNDEDTGDGPTATFRLIDTEGNWYGESELVPIGCAGESQGLLPGDARKSADTAQAAAQAVAEWLKERDTSPSPGTLTVERVNVGYRDGAVQVWLARVGQEPFRTIQVEHYQGKYVALPRGGCGGNQTDQPGQGNFAS